ncbi:hypothetical protein HGRIS_014146 [Hohenbuehelia grisea]|uniref:F-box domain-containing protein n=1 Tax=Hohenbuehelia grisea TaxID=104357 RepID=A0ABR3JSN0_9AGAR
MASISDIPAELILHVFECAGFDRPTLKTCSLVCKSWTPIAYSHLFRSASWTARMLEPVPHQPAPSCFIHIEDMTIYFPRLTPETLQNAGICMKKLVNVRMLHVNHPQFSDLDQPKLSVLSESFSGIVFLDITLGRITDLPRFIEFICSFPNLETLRLQHILLRQETPPYAYTGSSRMPLSFHTLETAVGGPVAQIVAQWFMSHEPRLPLVTIKMEFLEEPIISLIRSMPTTLQALHCNIWDPLPEELPCEFGLQSFVSLQSIRLMLPVFESQQRYPSSRIISGIIAGITPSTPLQDVMLGFNLMTPRRPLEAIRLNEVADWPAIDRIFGAQHFPTLKTITLKLVHFGSTDLRLSLESTLRDFLPHCDSRGVLRIDIKDTHTYVPK